MNRPRVPVVVGLGPRAGAGTVAAALHANEARPDAPDRGGGVPAADVAVCSGEPGSLRRAEALHGASVLVIALIDDQPPPSDGYLRTLGHHHGTVAVLPHVPHWSGLTATPVEAAALLAQRPEYLPPALRAYTDALLRVAALLLRGGSLARPTPPTITARPTVTAPPTITARPPLPALSGVGLDDDAIEARVLAAEATAAPAAEAEAAAAAAAAETSAAEAPAAETSAAEMSAAAGSAAEASAAGAGIRPPRRAVAGTPRDAPTALAGA